LIALTKGALADFAISHGEPDPEEQVFPNAWDPAVISYLVLIVVLPIEIRHTGLPDIFRVGARRRGLIWNCARIEIRTRG
jgi:hypothetical protein